MNPMKRVGLAAVMVVGVTLLASTPARADTYTYELTNVCDSGDQDADATGQVIHGEWRLRGKYPAEWWECHATIECQKLTPGATYATPLGTFQANRNGNGKVSGNWISDRPWVWWVPVRRLNADGSWTDVLW
jgi:hypothetical protein